MNTEKLCKCIKILFVLLTFLFGIYFIYKSTHPPRSAPFEKLLDAGRDDPPFNKNSYPGFDQKNQYIGINVPLDKMYRGNTKVIENNNRVSMPLDKMYRTNSTVRPHEPVETI